MLWLNKKFTITFNDGDKTFTEIKNIKRWDKLNEPSNPKKEGHIFDGWYLDGERFDFSKSIKKDIELEAKWYKKEYTITLKTNKNEETKAIKFGDTIEEPASPKKKGYTFVGWYSNGKKYDFDSLVKEEIVLEAKFQANTNTKYKVEHYLMDLNSEYTILKDVDYLEGKTDSIIFPETKEYVGFKSPEKKELKINADGSSVLKYYYERNKYELKLKLSEGIDELHGSDIYYYDENVEISTTLLDGYSFDNWGNNDNKLKTTINIKDNIILSPKTIRNTYTVSFDTNKGSKIENVEVIYKDKIVKPTPPVRDGYTFTGWYIDKELTIEYNFDSIMPHNNVTLYAIYAKDVTVTNARTHAKSISNPRFFMLRPGCRSSPTSLRPPAANIRSGDGYSCHSAYSSFLYRKCKHMHSILFYFKIVSMSRKAASGRELFYILFMVLDRFAME